MACSSCNSKKSNKTNRVSREIEIVENCEYTFELITLWKEKLECIKKKDLLKELNLTKYRVNSGIGYLQSALNIQDACKFQKQIDKVRTIILSLIDSQKCQTL